MLVSVTKERLLFHAYLLYKCKLLTCKTAVVLVRMWLNSRCCLVCSILADNFLLTNTNYKVITQQWVNECEKLVYFGSLLWGNECEKLVYFGSLVMSALPHLGFSYNTKKSNHFVVFDICTIFFLLLAKHRAACDNDDTFHLAVWSSCISESILSEGYPLQNIQQFKQGMCIATGFVI